MNKNKSSRSRELMERLYESSGFDVTNRSIHDDDCFDEASTHPEAPINDSIELAKRTARAGAVYYGAEGREHRIDDEDLEYLEFIAEKRARQRRLQKNQSKKTNPFSLAFVENRKKTEWSCPVLLACAFTCVLTIGFVKGQEISSFIENTWLHNQPASPAVANILLNTTPGDGANFLQRVPGLSASRSTITGFADSQSMTAGYYWTLQISNTGQQNQEARMRIALPPGVTLSRATLWVNGTPQEAAFSSTSQVTAAYNWVRDGRQEQRYLSHDPLVITQESPGHLLVKAAPITPDGKPLQLRLGFTAPLIPTSSQSSVMRLPQITESNFEVKGTHDVHLQSETSVWSNESEVTGIPDQTAFLLRGNIDGDKLSSLRINVAGSSGAQFATRATHSPTGTYIVATMKPTANGRMSLSLKKTTTRPSCKLINSEPAAVRLSTLWAYGQIESNARQGNWFAANEIAQIFRVVSSVSGATVLEQESDYWRNGLSRNQFATYNQRLSSADSGDVAAFGAAGGPQGFGGAAPKAKAPSPPSFSEALPMPSPRRASRSTSIAAPAIDKQAAIVEILSNVVF